jgi:hypothetical protein
MDFMYDYFIDHPKSDVELIKDFIKENYVQFDDYTLEDFYRILDDYEITKFSKEDDDIFTWYRENDKVLRDLASKKDINYILKSLAKIDEILTLKNSKIDYVNNKVDAYEYLLLVKGRQHPKFPEVKKLYWKPIWVEIDDKEYLYSYRIEEEIGKERLYHVVSRGYHEYVKYNYTKKIIKTSGWESPYIHKTVGKYYQIFFHDNISIEGNFKNGYMVGKWIITNLETGEISSGDVAPLRSYERIHILNNLRELYKEGRWLTINNDGIVTKDVTYHSFSHRDEYQSKTNKTIKTGKCFYKYPNGNKRKIAIYNKDGRRVFVLKYADNENNSRIFRVDLMNGNDTAESWDPDTGVRTFHRSRFLWEEKSPNGELLLRELYDERGNPIGISTRNINGRNRYRFNNLKPAQSTSHNINGI